MELLNATEWSFDSCCGKWPSLIIIAKLIHINYTITALVIKLVYKPKSSSVAKGIK
jgi:hypothetical protein